MKKYFKVSKSSIQNKPLDLGIPLRLCSDEMKVKLVKNITLCNVYAIIKKQSEFDSYFNEIVIINLKLKCYENARDLVVNILKAIKYQTIVCVHWDDKVCFFSGIAHPNNHRPYLNKIDSLCHSRVYNIIDDDLNKYSFKRYSSPTLKELYAKISEAFDLSSKDYLTTTFVGELYTYICGLEPDFFKYRDYILGNCGSMEIINNSGNVKTVHSFQQVYDFLTRHDILLDGDDLVDDLYCLIRDEEEFYLVLPPLLRQQVDDLTAENDKAFNRAINNNEASEADYDEDYFIESGEEYADSEEDNHSMVDDLFYSS